FWVGFAGAMTASLAVLGGIAWLITAVVVSPAREKFVSSTFDFELPEGWGCDEEGSETVCTAGPAPHDAIVILARKMRGPADTLAGYEEHLAGLTQSAQAEGRANGGEVGRVRRRTIGKHEWVESLQLGSEVSGYLTRYLATVTSHIGVLVTVSMRADR